MKDALVQQRVDLYHDCCVFLENKRFQVKHHIQCLMTVASSGQVTYVLLQSDRDKHSPKMTKDVSHQQTAKEPHLAKPISFHLNQFQNQLDKNR
jgi:hypothetical protein